MRFDDLIEKSSVPLQSVPGEEASHVTPGGFCVCVFGSFPLVEGEQQRRSHLVKKTEID